MTPLRSRGCDAGVHQPANETGSLLGEGTNHSTRRQIISTPTAVLRPHCQRNLTIIVDGPAARRVTGTCATRHGASYWHGVGRRRNLPQTKHYLSFQPLIGRLVRSMPQRGALASVVIA
jgi:hypothetical protein